MLPIDTLISMVIRCVERIFCWIMTYLQLILRPRHTNLSSRTRIHEQKWRQRHVMIQYLETNRIISHVHQGPSTNESRFRHPPLTQEEFQAGCRLGIDSFADTSCAGKHAHVLEFNDDITVSATGFAGKDTMCINDLSIANVAYAYDTPQGDTLIFVVNNAIYLGDLMDGSLLNPVQRMEHGIKIDIQPRLFYPDTPTAQTFEIPSLQRLFPIQYEGSVPFLHVRKPTQEEIQTCTHVRLP